MSARLNPPPESDSGLAKPANPIVADIRSGLYNLPQEMPDPVEPSPLANFKPEHAPDFEKMVPIEQTQAAGLVRRAQNNGVPPMIVSIQRKDGWIEPTQEVRDLARKQIGPKLDDTQFALYLFECKLRDVHPLSKLIVPIIIGGKLVFISSIDFFRLNAQRSKEYAGSDDATFQYDDAGKPQAASITVWRIVLGVRCPFTATARWSEYKTNGPTWVNKPHIMIAKCAEALALRKGFPAELCGLYVKEELDQAQEEEPPPRPAAVQDANAISAPTRQERADVPKRETPPPAAKPPPNGGDVFASPEWRQLTTILNDPKRGLTDHAHKVQAMADQLGRAVPSGKTGWTLELVRDVLAAFTGDPVKAGGFDREAFAPWGNGTPPAEPPEEYK